MVTTPTHAQPVDLPDFKIDAQMADYGKQVYSQSCFLCHGGGERREKVIFHSGFLEGKYVAQRFVPTRPAAQRRACSHGIQSPCSSQARGAASRW